VLIPAEQYDRWVQALAAAPSLEQLKTFGNLRHSAWDPLIAKQMPELASQCATAFQAEQKFWVRPSLFSFLHSNQFSYFFLWICL
jgi:hypothetical protein